MEAFPERRDGGEGNLEKKVRKKTGKRLTTAQTWANGG